MKKCINIKECEDCGRQYTNIKRKCDSCNGKVAKKVTSHVKCATPNRWKFEKLCDVGQNVNNIDSTSPRRHMHPKRAMCHTRAMRAMRPTRIQVFPDCESSRF